MPATAECRMSLVDTAWLRMDNEVNLMMIVGVWLLTPAISLAALRERTAERLLRYERFHQSAVLDATGASWVDSQTFNIADHVVLEVIKRQRGLSERAALQQRCGELASKRLDPGKPLWQFHLVERYEGGCALIARIHHCIGDGVALVSVMHALVDGGIAPTPQTGPAAAPLPARDLSSDSDGWSEAVLRPLTGLAVNALSRSGDGLDHALRRMVHPGRTLQAALDLANKGRQLLRDAASLLLMEDDTPTRLKGKPIGRKLVAWGDPLPLDRVKAVSHALACSINDLLLTCASGALGGWLRDQGDDPRGAEIRAMVPVNLRLQGPTYQLGNEFGLAPLMLPIGIANPVERLYAVRTRMDQLKQSYQPVLAYGVLGVAGLLVKPGQDLLLRIFSRKATAVVTNLPGPRECVKLCGATLRQAMFWVPASGDIGVGLSILSYGGGVQFALITDAALCPDPQAIVDRFSVEFEQLLWLSLMLPWGDVLAA